MVKIITQSNLRKLPGERVLLFIFWLWILLGQELFASAIPVLPYQPTTAKIKRVMILNSYHNTYLWTDQITDAVKQQISARFKDVEYYVEYMDAKRLCSEELTQNIYQNLKLKYHHIKLDIIIVSDDDALLFMRRFHDDLFPDVPVVFCGINEEKNLQGLPRRYYTGLLEVLDVKPNIELIKKLWPQTQKIYVISDCTTTGLALRRLVSEAAPDFPNIRFIFLKGEDLSTSEMLKQLNQLDQRSAVFMNVWFRDKNNEFIAYKDINPMMSATCPVPIFGMIDMLIDLNIVGGKMNGGNIQGRKAGEMAVKIMTGETTAAQLPINTSSPNEYMFDSRQLQRFHISEKLLPPGSKVFHRQFSFYQTYKPLVWSVTATLLTFLAMIIALAINGHRLKLTQLQLVRNKQDLNIILNSLGEGVIATDMDGNIIRMNPVAERLTGWSEAEAAGKPFTQIFHAVAENSTPLNSPVALVLETGYPATTEKNARLISQDQSEWQISSNCSPLRDENNQVIGTVVIFHDITEEYALQEKLRQAEKTAFRGAAGGRHRPRFQQHAGRNCRSCGTPDQPGVRKGKTICRHHQRSGETSIMPDGATIGFQPQKTIRDGPA